MFFLFATCEVFCLQFLSKFQIYKWKDAAENISSEISQQM